MRGLLHLVGAFPSFHFVILVRAKITFNKYHMSYLLACYSSSFTSQGPKFMLEKISALFVKQMLLAIRQRCSNLNVIEFKQPFLMKTKEMLTQTGLCRSKSVNHRVEVLVIY